MHNIGENEITNMGGNFNYVNCECITNIKNGKNLFNKGASVVVNNLKTHLTELPTGVKATLEAFRTYSYGGIVISDINRVIGKTFTLSANINASGTNAPSIKIFGVNNNYSPVTEFCALNSSGNITFTIPDTVSSNITKLEILFYANLNSSTAQAGDYVEYTNVQLEEGSTATDYEPYKGW